MKTIIAFITTVICSASFALTMNPDGITLAHVQGVNQKISSISLMESGTLVVTKINQQQRSFKLSKSNFDRLNFLAQTLQTAQLAVEHRMVVCMMVLNPMYLQTLTTYDPKTGNMRLTLSAQNCAMSQVTHPKDKTYEQFASELRELMVALANQFARF